MEDDDNIIIEDVEFDPSLYEKNITENEFNTEYEAGDSDADN